MVALSDVVDPVEDEHDVLGQHVGPLEDADPVLQAHAAARGVGRVGVVDAVLTVWLPGERVDGILHVGEVVHHVEALQVGVEDSLSEEAVPAAGPAGIVGVVEAVGPESGPGGGVVAQGRDGVALPGDGVDAVLVVEARQREPAPEFAARAEAFAGVPVRQDDGVEGGVRGGVRVELPPLQALARHLPGHHDADAVDVTAADAARPDAPGQVVPPGQLPVVAEVGLDQVAVEDAAGNR